MSNFETMARNLALMCLHVTWSREVPTRTVGRGSAARWLFLKRGQIFGTDSHQSITGVGGSLR